MKKAILLFAAAAMVASSTVAAAQPRRDDGRRYDNRRDDSRYRPGQRLDQRYRSPRYEFNDWQRYRLSPPPRGYRYYRDDNGNVVLAAIATGVIAFALADIFNNNNNNYNNGYRSGGGNVYYGDPDYGRPYGGQPVWYDRYGRPYTVDRYGRSVWLD